MTSVRLEALDHVGLAVADVATSVAWYQDVLGLRRAHEQTWGDFPAVLEANAGGMKGAVPAAADRLMEEVIVWGTPVEARQRLARWHAAGADLVGLLLRPNLTADQLKLTLEAFHPMTAPAAPRTS